jgi:hypothetical protein
VEIQETDKSDWHLEVDDKSLHFQKIMIRWHTNQWVNWLRKITHDWNWWKAFEINWQDKPVMESKNYFFPVLFKRLSVTKQTPLDGMAVKSLGYYLPRKLCQWRQQHLLKLWGVDRPKNCCNKCQKKKNNNNNKKKKGLTKAIPLIKISSKWKHIKQK